jgi:hypothetical protein
MEYFDLRKSAAAGTKKVKLDIHLVIHKVIIDSVNTKVMGLTIKRGP